MVHVDGSLPDLHGPSRLQLHQIPYPGDLVYNQNPCLGDRPHNQISMGSLPPFLGLKIARCINRYREDVVINSDGS